MKNPIGIFDSGIGGLTVVKQLSQLLPNEQLVYFGDTARVPYGTKSRRLVQQYALEDAHFLLQFDVKMIVIACNSASAAARELLQQKLDVPVLGVVAPGASAAVQTTSNKKIGVIGTSATISSSAYEREIKKNQSDLQVFGQPCPLLVPLVEEGWLDDEVTTLAIRKYLSGLMKEQVDTLILGCTHYPVLEPAIQKIVGNNVTLIDSGKETAKAVKKLLSEKNMLHPGIKEAPDQFYVSDIPAKFEEIGSAFLGKKLDNVERVDFDQFLIQSGLTSEIQLQD
jgi:glutamate racemase